MSGFSPAEIPILGDQSLPWFDPDWPWNLGRVAPFAPSYSSVLSVRPDYSVMMGLFDRPVIEIDFSKVSVVAMRTGCGGLLWEHCEPQQVLIRFENQWLVLLRHISEIEVHKFFDGKADALNEISWALRNELPCQTYVQLGAEGDRSERVIASTNYDGECKLVVFNPRSEPYRKEWFCDGVRKTIAKSDRFSMHCFTGDYAIRTAVDFLASWGFVQSKHWPTITRRFPELNEFNAYLIHECQLYPDGSHPLHGVPTQAPQRADNQADDDGVIDPVARSMVWGDDKFNDIPARGIKVLDLLLKAYRDGNRVVSLNEIVSLGVSVDGGMIGQVFKHKSGRHKVSKVIDDLGGGRYRLKHPRKDS
jgi:hypothetical protein